jgi:enamidase
MLLAFCLAVPSVAGAQRPILGPGTRTHVPVDTAVVALTNARIIDGTGAPARADQTLVIRDRRIAEVGPVGRVAVPAGALVIVLTGKSVLPGLVMVHEHRYYPAGGGTYDNFTESFIRRLSPEPPPMPRVPHHRTPPIG